MGTIRVLEHVQHCYNGDDGQVIHEILSSELKKENEVITLSFSGVDSVPSSFVNSALISLLKDFPFTKIKLRLKFENTNSQINEMIKSRFSFELEKLKKKTSASH